MEVGWLGGMLTVLVLASAYNMYVNSDERHLRCIISSRDGNRYCVRERAKLEMAADRLAEVRQRLDATVDHIRSTPNGDEAMRRITERYKPNKIMETLPTSEHTAYTENKGKKIAFCLDTEREGGRLIDINTLTFVGLHEISHIGCKSIGHTPEYWAIFKQVLSHAVDAGAYDPVDYSRSPARYCGMQITDNPYFDE